MELLNSVHLLECNIVEAGIVEEKRMRLTQRNGAAKRREKEPKVLATWSTPQHLNPDLVVCAKTKAGRASEIAVGRV
jgi:hypothetical protein